MVTNNEKENQLFSFLTMRSGLIEHEYTVLSYIVSSHYYYAKMTTDINETYLPPKQRLVAWMSRLYKHGLTTTTGGNLSFIDDDGVMYITPSGGDKGEVSPKNVSFCRPGSSVFEGVKRPSMEWQLHEAAYSARPNCRAVLHAHSVALIAFSLAVKGTDILDNCFQGHHQGVPGMEIF